MTEIIEIPLGNNLIAWVDEEDACLARMGWHAKSAGKNRAPTYYAVHQWTVGKTRGEYFLHNLVWERANDAPVPKGFLVDHINRDKLDNRRENLRLATRKDNEANKRKRRGKTTSKYKGVTKMNTGKRKKKWRSTITVDKKQVALGSYMTEVEAARAYDERAIVEFGEFAWLNFPQEHKHEQHDD
jgi:hypothetical protein